MYARKDSRVLYVGGQGCVYALRAEDGSVLWERELKKGGWFKVVLPFLSLVEDKDVLYAFTGGRLFVLDKNTGKVLVEGEEIKKMKYVPAVLAGDSAGAAAAIATVVQQTQNSSAAAAAGMGH
jgi:outer membrane protein assembly factor BamB